MIFGKRMTKKYLGLLAILPLFTIGIFANYDNFANAAEELVCMDGEVTVVRVTNPNSICVDENTANRWVQLGIATIVGEEEMMMEETIEEEMMMEETIEEEMMEVPMEAPMEAPMEEKMHAMWQTSTGTISSMLDPGVGHETHQLAIILPPSDNVYKGILTYSTSEPIQLVALHGPLAEGEDNGQPIWTPDGETKFALTFVDPESSMGTWAFAGNALAVHTMNEEQFTTSYSITYIEKDMSDTVMTGTISSMLDPGVGHETHQLAIILPPSEDTYHGVLTYSASEPIQLVALHGPLAEGEDNGQPIWTPDGETKFALTFVDPESSMGTWAFAGNALAVHTMNEEQFTVSYSVVAGQ